MHKAVEKVVNNEMNARQTAERYQVPRTMLNYRVSALKNIKVMAIDVH